MSSCPICGAELRLRVLGVEDNTPFDDERPDAPLRADFDKPKYVCPNGHDVDALHIRT